MRFPSVAFGRTGAGAPARPQKGERGSDLDEDTGTADGAAGVSGVGRDRLARTSEDGGHAEDRSVGRRVDDALQVPLATTEIDVDDPHFVIVASTRKSKRAAFDVGVGSIAVEVDDVGVAGAGRVALLELQRGDARGTSGTERDEDEGRVEAERVDVRFGRIGTL
jgi:hypothetical protein